MGLPGEIRQREIKACLQTCHLRDLTNADENGWPPTSGRRRLASLPENRRPEVGGHLANGFENTPW